MPIGEVAVLSTSGFVFAAFSVAPFLYVTLRQYPPMSHRQLAFCFRDGTRWQAGYTALMYSLCILAHWTCAFLSDNDIVHMPSNVLNSCVSQVSLKGSKTHVCNAPPKHVVDCQDQLSWAQEDATTILIHIASMTKDTVQEYLSYCAKCIQLLHFVQPMPMLHLNGPVVNATWWCW